MSGHRHVREIILLALFLIASFGVGIISFISSNQQAKNTTSAQAASNVDNYCRNGVYYVKNPNGGDEISCGRGTCGGVSYGGTAGINHVSAGKCWVGSSDCGPACQGLVPLCCYKMAETGDATDCPFPERKYCRQDQCKQQTKNVDSNCGSGINSYCVIPNCLEDRDDVPVLSLEDRIAGRKAPGGNNAQATNTPIPPTSIPPTNPPTQQPVQQNTPTTAPSQPTPTSTSQQNPNIATTPVEVEPTQRVQQPSPTSSDTFVFDFGNNDETGDFGSNQNNKPTTGQQNNTSQASPTVQPDSDNQPLSFSLPQIEVQSPKQMLRETLDQPTVEKINVATEKPLAVAKNTFVTVKTYDQKLEDTVEGWFFQIRISIINLF